MTLPFIITGEKNITQDQQIKVNMSKKKANLRVGWKEQTDIVNNISIVFLAVKSEDIVCYQKCLKWKKEKSLLCPPTKPKLLHIINWRGEGGGGRALVVWKAELQPLRRSAFQQRRHLISCMQGWVCPCWFFHKNTLHLNLIGWLRKYWVLLIFRLHDVVAFILERENWPRFSRHGGNTTVQHALITCCSITCGVQLTTPENTITVHNTLCLSPQTFA